jgi:hypothetical protein
MPTKKELCDDLDFMSDRLSTQTRTIALGLLAATWALLLSESPSAKTVASSLSIHLLLIGDVCVIALLIDYFHYVSGYFVDYELLKRMEANKLDSAQFEKSDLLYKLRKYCFYGKQIFTIVGAVWFLLAIASRLFH